MEKRNNEKTDHNENYILYLIIIIVLILVYIVIFYLFFKDANNDIIDNLGDNGRKDNIVSDEFLVTKVIDGDTIVLSNEDIVRLLCVDTAENGEEDYTLAKDFLENLLLGRTITLEKDVVDSDMYNRKLRYVYLNKGKSNEIFVNQHIIDSGLSEVYYYNGSLCERMN